LRSRGDDSGVATTELVLLFPLVFSLMMFIVQVGLYTTAVQTLRGAADAGVTAGRFVQPVDDLGCEAFGVDPTDGARDSATRQATTDYITALASGNIQSARIDTSGTTITCQAIIVTVRGEINMMIGGTISLRVASGSPVERFRPDV